MRLAAVVDAVEVDDVEVQVQGERRAKPLDRRDRPGLPAVAPGLVAIPPRDAAQCDLEQALGEVRPSGEQPAPSPGHRHHPLSGRRQREDAVNPVRRPLVHPATRAARAEAAGLAGEQHAAVVVAVLAVQPGEAPRGIPAAEVGFELPGDKLRKRPVVPRKLGHEQRHALAQDLAQLRVRVSSKFDDASHRRRQGQAPGRTRGAELLAFACCCVVCASTAVGVRSRQTSVGSVTVKSLNVTAPAGLASPASSGRRSGPVRRPSLGRSPRWAAIAGGDRGAPSADHTSDTAILGRSRGGGIRAPGAVEPGARVRHGPGVPADAHPALCRGVAAVVGGGHRVLGDRAGRRRDSR